MPEMRPVTIRFGQTLWELIEEEANRDHVSAAHWIRDAALMRSLWERNRRGSDDGLEVLQAVRDQYRAEDEAFHEVVSHILKHSRAELDAIIASLPDDLAEVVRRWYGLENEEAPGD